MHVCESSTRRPRAPSAHLRQPGQQRPNLEGARASRPDRKNFRLPCRKDWLWLPKRALLSWPGRLSRGERLKGNEALPPRCREANGGVAMVAAGAAMNRNGGHHAEVAHP